MLSCILYFDWQLLIQDIFRFKCKLCSVDIGIGFQNWWKILLIDLRTHLLTFVGLEYFRVFEGLMEVQILREPWIVSIILVGFELKL